MARLTAPIFLTCLDCWKTDPKTVLKEINQNSLVYLLFLLRNYGVLFLRSIFSIDYCGFWVEHLELFFTWCNNTIGLFSQASSSLQFRVSIDSKITKVSNRRLPHSAWLISIDKNGASNNFYESLHKWDDDDFISCLCSHTSTLVNLRFRGQNRKFEILLSLSSLLHFSHDKYCIYAMFLKA